MTLAFSPDGAWIASSGDDQTVRIWNSTTGKEAVVFRGGGCHYVCFSTDGKKLVAAASLVVNVWDVSALSRLLAGNLTDSAIAEAVLRLGGSVVIRQNGNEQPIEKLEQLPRESFELIEASLEGNQNVNDDNVAVLKDATRLRSLSLGHTSVSDRGLEWIGNLTQLEHLGLWHSQITGKTVERMRPLTDRKSVV